MDESWNICSRAVHRLVHTLILRWCQIQLMSNAFWPKILEWLCWFFFYIVKHFYHEPVARGIGRPPPVYLTLNKLSSFNLSYAVKKTYNLSRTGVLGFFYWTGAKEHYTELQLPSLNLPSDEGITERLDRISLSRRVDPGVFASNKALFAQREQLTVRAQFHRTHVELPPTLLEDGECFIVKNYLDPLSHKIKLHISLYRSI